MLSTLLPNDARIAERKKVVKRAAMQNANTCEMSNVITDSLFLGLAAGIASTISTPDTSAFVGSLAAAVIALNDARSTQKDRRTLACVVIASIVVGMLLPGGIMFNWYPDVAARWTFHLWTLSGLVCGLLGWGAVLVVLAGGKWIIARKDKLAHKAGQHFTGIDDK